MSSGRKIWTWAVGFLEVWMLSTNLYWLSFIDSQLPRHLTLLLSVILGRKLSSSDVLSLKFLPLLSFHTLVKVDTTYLYLSFNIRGWSVSWSKQISLSLLLTFFMFSPMKPGFHLSFLPLSVSQSCINKVRLFRSLLLIPKPERKSSWWSIFL